MNRDSVEKYLNHLTALDGNIEILTNIRPEDKNKLYLYDTSPLQMSMQIL